MKKLVIFCLVLFWVNLVLATGIGNQAQITNFQESGDEGDTNIGLGIQEKAKTGSYLNSEGKNVRLEKETGNKLRIHAGESFAECDCNLTQEQVQNKTRFHLALSNGRNAEIKIMPDTASEIALERLRLKVCTEENNCTLQLKEVGQGNQTKAGYELQIQRHSRILGIFQAKMQTQTQIDAETGEIILVNKPWWAFLATEPAEE